MILYHQENGTLETAETRTARFDAAIKQWRREGFAYVTLSPRGMAQPHHAGKLAALLAAVARHPGAQLVELAADDARARVITWALTPRPIDTKGTN